MNFSSETADSSQNETHNVFRVLREKNCQLVKISLLEEREIRTFSDKVEPREFVTIRPDLNELLGRLSSRRTHYQGKLGIPTRKEQWNGIST